MFQAMRLSAFSSLTTVSTRNAQQIMPICILLLHMRKSYLITYIFHKAVVRINSCPLRNKQATTGKMCVDIRTIESAHTISVADPQTTQTERERLHIKNPEKSATEISRSCFHFIALANGKYKRRAQITNTL